MFYTCSKDATHQSTESDYCSICGAKIVGAASALSAPSVDTPAPQAASLAAATSEGGETCPDCGTPRRMGAKFCEVCRFNFETRASASAAPTPVQAAPPVDVAAPVDTSTTPPAADQAPIDAPPLSAEAALVKWDAVATVDCSLYADPDPNIPCPANEPERVFPLDFAENLIGRRSDRKDIHPEITLSDPGVSHRHAKLLRQQDGTFVLLDVGSTNGTQLNDADVPVGVPTPLKVGDQITLGCWTRITIKARGNGDSAIF